MPLGQLAVADPSAVASQIFVIERPAPNEVKLIDIAQAHQISFHFPLESCRIAVLDIDVILTFPDEGRIILPAFALQLVTADPPRLAFGNVSVEAQSFVAEIGSTTLSDQFPKIAVSDTLIQSKTADNPDAQPPAPVTLPSAQTIGLTPTPQTRKYETSTGDLIAPDTGRFAKHTNQDFNQAISNSSGGGGSTATPTTTPAIPVTPAEPANQPPHITSDGGAAQATLQIKENSTLVTSVHASDPDGGAPHYIISGGADAARFSISATSGALSFIKGPDFEQPASAQGSNSYALVVSAIDERGGIADQRITVEVTNVNEAPVITSSNGAAVASIDVLGGTSLVSTIAAADPDAGTTLAYSIVGGADAAKFVINAANGLLSFVTPPVFAAPTDVGADNVYNVVVRASDGQLSADQSLAVIVKNDDHPPQIVSNGGGSTAGIGLMENSTIVTTVVGSDPDFGNTLHYFIGGGADASKFAIDYDTGVLRFLSNPNFEAPADAGHDNVYDVVVQVSDGSLSANQTLAITINDVNEAPVITSNGGGANASIVVVEHTSAVTSVVGFDQDASSVLSYWITGGADAAKFAIDALTGALSFITSPDFQSHGSAAGTNSYDVIVATSDGALAASQHLTVDVTQNASGLIITSNGGGSVVLVGIGENSTAVTTVVASDPNPLATLSYSIVGGSDASKFTIDAASGALTFVAAPNFEIPGDVGGHNLYDVIVQAFNGSQTAQQQIEVLVTNVNEAPVITSDGGGPTASITVNENATLATTVVGVDPDAGSTLSYSIVGGADAAKFTINASTGVLSFISAPNFEAPGDAGGNNVYDVVVQTTDGTFTASQAIAVAVANVNEAPVITSNGGGNFVLVNVFENTTAVTTVTAVDPDAATVLTYSIVGGTDAGKFTIDSVTGALSFIAPPDFEMPTDSSGHNIYDVIVQSSDGSLSSSQKIEVIVGNVNEAPVITSNGGGASAAISVSENSTAVTTVIGFDPDAATTLHYAIIGGADAAKFSININTGALSFVSAPNFEAPTDIGGNNVYDVVVQVTDGTLNASQAIAVTVVDVNETPKIISNGGGPSASISILENTIGVTTVIGSDPDAATTLHYAIGGGADGALFTIDANTGVLSFISAPNFEAPTDAGGNNVYDVIVQTTDGSLTASQAIAVSVGNVNEAPVITSDGGGATASKTVFENTTVVTTVTAVDPDGGTTLTYSISGGADAALFTINPSTGALSFISAPNFEAPTDAGANNVYDVIVRTSDGTLTATQAIAVTVSNVNEAPTITSNGGGASASITINENSTAVTTVIGSDPDAATVLTYSISGGADAAKFTINASTGVLSFISAPNFEAPTDVGANNVYDVIVRTSDGSLTATQAIAVTVANVNEPPVITSNGGGTTASKSISENTTAVTTVTATDPDAATTLVYSISGGADAAKFTINSSTGVLTFISAPNFEAPTDVGANNVYDVIVKVTDGTLNDTQSIAVTITNVNETPSITSNGGGTSASVSITENSTAVTTVIGSDPDAATVLTYSIFGGADASKFTINASTGVLSFISAPNFEAPTDAGANNVYDVIVQTSDGSLTANQSIAVTVTNVNEAPTITSNGGGTSASISIFEDTTAVTTVVGSDPDAATTLHYGIVGGADASKFAIDFNTGVLTFVSAPNFETPTDFGGDNVYNVIVQTTDGSLTANQSIAVTVVNSNEPPVIISNGGGPTASISITENATAVTTVIGSDPDAATTLIYSIIGGADSAKFTINSSTGVLSFISAPNFEAPADIGGNNVYDVIVQTSDGSLTASQSIAVTVTDVNEAPVIVSDGGGASASVTAFENQTSVTTVVGTDQDAATTLTYSISGGADAAKFAINFTTGVLSFVSAPNFEAPADAGADNVYDVIVKVSDGSLSTTQAIAVTLANVNEAPSITSNGGGPSASISIGENISAVTTVTGSDPDAATLLTYSIIGGADAAKFSIDPSTGALTFISAPNFEAPADAGANNVYDVIVQTSDGVLTASQSIAVTITNVNEAPVITSNGGGPSASVTVNENSTAVTTVVGSDPDAATTLHYAIAGGADAARFTININTGVLTFVSAPNFESPADMGGDNVYDVIVQTSDGSLTATQAIAITVMDVNEAPVITSNGGGATASVSINENTTAVTTVVGSDPDAATLLTYTIVGGVDAAKFSIDPSTGVLSFISAPNFEAPTDFGANNVYDVIVQTSDGVLTATQSIAVTVTNVNETPSIVSNGGGASASISINENTSAVTTVVGSDPDASTTLSYSIVGGADAARFTINASTGALNFIAAPNFEAPSDAGGDNIYDVIVQTSDGSLTASQALAITVADINEAPTITSNGGGPTASVTINENTSAVTTVTGADPDASTTLSYAIVGGADAAKFSIDPSTGVLSFISAPNFEAPTDFGANNVYDVIVQTSDGALSASQSIAVTVTNVNEAPVITSNGGGPTASITINENTSAVTTVTGADPDASTALSYSIVGGADAARFTINASTGALSFITAPNFEAPTDAGGDNVYNVIVQTSDGSLTASQALAITVADINEAPTITSNGGGPSAAVSVSENFTAVTTVVGSDPDAATTLHYAIIGGADAAKFTIDINSGVLTFVTAPDFEAPTDVGGNNVYDVIVQTSDGALTANQSLAVTVNNLNEFPTITSNGGGNFAAISIQENTTAVTTVTATDPDAATTLSYSIIGGADAAQFTINALTGVLSFVAPPDFETPSSSAASNTYDIIVLVSDGSLSDAQAISVTVTDVNEAPVITSNGGGPTASIIIGENSTAVTTVVGSDPDASTTLSYSITGGADAAKFTINSLTGALSFLSAPNFEAPTDVGGNNVYDVIVRTSDGVLTDTQAIAVTVTNVNEAPSIISDGGGPTASITIGENTTAVTTVVGSDPDAATTLHYAIIGGADASAFTIDTNTGALSFASAPNFEAPTDAGGNNTYDVIVQTSDGVLSASQTLAIHVTDVNEAPSIVSDGGGTTASIIVNENTTAVTTVVGADPDASTVLHYSIVGGADAAAFSIDANSGALSFLTAPNYEAPTDAGGNNIYDVVVQTSDGVLTDTQAIAVHIANVNEFAPSITSDGGHASASIYMADGSDYVTTVTATDADANPVLHYSLGPGGDAAQFTIDTNSGVLKFAATPIGTQSYDVDVQVNDGLYTSTQSLHIATSSTHTADFSGIGSGPSDHLSVDLGIQDTVQDTGVGGYVTLHGIDNVVGSQGTNTISGNDNDNVITGGPGSNTIVGFGGTDTVSAPSTATNEFTITSPTGTYAAGAQDDLAHIDVLAFQGGGLQVDLGGGNNSVDVTAGAASAVNLTQLRSVLTNIETIDLSNANLAADLTNFTGNDAKAILGAAAPTDTLTIATNGSTNFSVAASEYFSQSANVYTFYTDITHATEIAKVQLV